MRSNHLGLIFAAALIALLPLPAKAAMIYCNKTKNVIEAAIGYRDDTTWVSEGWWRINPGDCAHVLGKPLTQRFYFYYARSLTSSVENRPPVVWTGKYELCVETKAFRVEGDEDCELRKYHTLGFQEIDIGPNARDYKLEFKDSG